MAVKSRRSYKGAAVSNTLGSQLLVGGTTISLAATMSGWPTSSEPFFCVIDPGTAKEEKVCVVYATTTTLTVVDPADFTSPWGASANGRGVDNTTAYQHEAGAVIYPCITARDIDEANELVSKYGAQGSVVYQGASTFTELAVGTAGQVLKVNSGATAPEWGQVATAGIADSAVTSAKIADGTIVDADVNASAAIALSKLATGALPTAITVASANIVDGTIATADLADGSVTSAKIADGTIVTADIADSAVTSAKIADGTIVNADINASAAIAHTKLANITAGSVLMGNASNAPTATALSGDVTVDSSGVTAIGSGVIVNADINASAAIALSKLATGALPTAITVASANIVDGTIATGDIADGAVTSAKIADGTIATGDIADGAVTMAKTVIKSGSTVVTLSSGVGDVPHGMGTTPSTAVVTNGDHNAGPGVGFNIIQITSTNIQVKAIGSTSNATVRVNWIAIP